MKHLLLFSIRLYWLFVPTRFRRRCLFRETCSQFVFRRTQTDGFRAGWQALQLRQKTCRPGYFIHQLPDGKLTAVLANGQVEVIEKLNPAIIELQ